MTKPLVAALCGALAFGLYLATLAPTVGAGDSAELALAAGRGGIPHPPGYPLWVMAAWLFVHLPGLSLLGDLAWRANLFSAVTTALAVAGAALLALRLGRGRAAAAWTAGLVALAPNVWSQATVAEVHALTLLLLVAAGHAWLSAVRSPSRGAAIVFGLVVTLELTYHPTQIFLAPLALVAVANVARTAGVSRRALGVGVTLGLLPLLWLPLRALMAPELDAFGAARPDRLLSGWTRTFYGPLFQNSDIAPARLLGQFGAAGGFLLATAGPLGLVAAAFGVMPAWRRHRRATRLLGLTTLLVLLGPWLLLNATPDAPHRFSIEPTQVAVTLIVALLAGRGFDRLRALSRFGQLPVLHGFLRGRVLPGVAMMLTLILVQGVPQAAGRNRSDDRIARWYGEDLLQSVAAGATLFVEGDNELFLTAYVQKVEGVRPDVRLVHRRGYLVADPLGWRGVPRATVTRERGAREADFVRCSDAPVYFAARPEWLTGDDFAVRREGLAWRVTTRARATLERGPAPDPWPLIHAAAWRVAPGSLDFLDRKCLAGYYEARAERLMAEGDADAARRVWQAAADVAYDFPERPALLAALGIRDAEARR